MRLATPEQMREIDRLTIQEIGIPGMVLMEQAALRVVETVERLLISLPDRQILVLAGKGNNGGDAFAAARHLHNRGARVKVFSTAPAEETGGDALANFRILQKLGISVEQLGRQDIKTQLAGDLAAAELVVDGLLGTGISGEVRGVSAEVIRLVNGAGKKVISIDIPSGLNGATGKVMGECIRASATVTFGLPKPGLVIHPGCRYTGELIVADIGIPAGIYDQVGIQTYWIDRELAASGIPLRRSNSNKGDYGKLLIVTGSTGMTGAGRLCGAAALKCGAGLVYLGVPASLAPAYAQGISETVTLPLEDNGHGHLDENSIGSIEAVRTRMDVIAAGPGLSTASGISGVVEYLLENTTCPLVLDADALNVVAGNPGMLCKAKGPVVLTPHPGEMSRLAGISIEQVQNNRIDISCDFARQYGTVTVLKGSGTVVAAPDGRICINPTGNSGMATAGTGDVLTGIIAALLGQGADAVEAAVAGVYLHGLAGDNEARIVGEYGLMASDVVHGLPGAISSLTSDR